MQKLLFQEQAKKKVTKTVEKLGNAARGIQIDLNNVTEFDNKVSQSISLFPENRIDILVNCAGVHGDQKFGIVSEATYDAVMNTNLKGLFFMTQIVSNYMKEEKNKRTYS